MYRIDRAFLDKLEDLFVATQVVLYEWNGKDSNAIMSSHGKAYPASLTPLPTETVGDELWRVSCRCERKKFPAAQCLVPKPAEGALVVPLDIVDGGQEHQSLVIYTGNAEHCFSSTGLCEQLIDLTALSAGRTGPLGADEWILAGVVDLVKRRYRRVMESSLETWRLSLFQRDLKDLFVQFEPIVRRGGRVSIEGYEALARDEKDPRLKEPNKKPGFPVRWGNAATLWGRRFARELDRRAFEAAFTQYGSAYPQLQDYGPPKLFLNVNVATPLDDDWVDELKEISRVSKMPLWDVVLEISEMQDIPQIKKGNRGHVARMIDYRERMVQLRADLKIKWALDDFGVDYANPIRMIKLEPDYTKIDQAIVVSLDDNKETIQYVQDVMRQNNRGLTIAEGVREGGDGILQRLDEYNVPLVQGHYFGQPDRVPQTAFLDEEPACA